MLVPYIRFIEENRGVTPIRTRIRNRIGIVGEFSRGPANTPSFITGYSDFASRYGSDTRKGSLAYQAAFDQGAEDFCLVRVLGHATQSKGAVTFANAASKDNTLIFALRFVGEVVNIGTPAITEVITTSGKYTGTQSGRYYFKVTAIATGVATVKYTFVALGVTTPVDWDAVTSTITVTLATDKGVSKTVANGIATTFGIASQTNNLALAVGNEWTVRVNAYNFTLSINSGDLPNQVATAFIEKFNHIEPLGDIVRNAQDTGVVFSIDPGLEGAIGNRFSYYFELQDTVSPGITVTPNTSTNAVFMQGGLEGPANAYRDFYSLQGLPLLRLIAVSEGTWGNNLRVTLYPLSNTQFRLSIEDLNANNFNPGLQPESYLLSFANTDDQGFIQELQTSKFVRGIFLPQNTSPDNFDVADRFISPQRLAPADATITDVEDIKHPNYFGPSKLIEVSLENGYDGPPLTESDYIQAIQALEGQPVHIVLAAGIWDSPSIKATLLAHAENSNDLEGLRVAILNTRPGLIPEAARQETIGLDSARGIMVAGWGTYGGQPNAPRFGLAPDAVYAGKLAATPFFVAPNARRSAGRVFNVLELDTANYANTGSLQLYTDARLEILSVDPSSQSFVFINGRTLSSGTDFERISIRRTYDVLRQDLYDLTQEYKSEPNDAALRLRLTSSINAYMTEKLRAGEIASFKSAVADSTNNTQEDYVNGRLNIYVAFLPVYSADYIEITLARDTGTGNVNFSS